MANHLASLFGTDKTLLNCPFHCSIGGCRHGDSDVTVRRDHPYRKIVQSDRQEHFQDCYEDIFEELSKCDDVEILKCFLDGERGCEVALNALSVTLLWSMRWIGILQNDLHIPCSGGSFLKPLGACMSRSG